MTRLLNAEIRSPGRTIPVAQPQVMHLELYGHHVLLDANSLAAVEVSADAARFASEHPEEAARFSGILFSRAQPQWPVAFSRPTKLCLLVTNGCNLACRYCFIRDAVKRGELSVAQMTPEVGAQALALLQADVSVSFFGGEPLLAWDSLVAIAQQAQKRAAEPSAPDPSRRTAGQKKVSLHVTTNATLLDAERAAFLKENGFSILVSLDGPREVHNANRPLPDGDSYARALAGLELLSKAGIGKRVFLRATFDDPDTDLAGLLGYFRGVCDQGLATGVSIEPAVLSEDCRTADLECVGFDRLAVRYHEAAEWYVAQVRAGTPFDFAPFRKAIQRILYTRHMHSECGAGVGYLTIGPEGNIYACHKASQCRIGDLRYGVDELARSAWSDNRIYTRSECMTCWARYLCGGGCRHHRLALTGDVRGHAPVLCAERQMLLREALWIVAELGPERLKEFIR